MVENKDSMFHKRNVRNDYFVQRHNQSTLGLKLKLKIASICLSFVAFCTEEVHTILNVILKLKITNLIC